MSEPTGNPTPQDAGNNRPHGEDVEPRDAETAGAADATEDSSRSGIAAFVSNLPWWVWAVIGAVVIAIVVVAIVVLGGKDSETPAVVTTTAAPVTQTEPAPEPTGTPLDHSDGTALFVALPDSAAQFVLAAAAENDTWTADGGAIESYALTYVGPMTDTLADTVPQDATYAATVGQWKTAKAAAAFADTLARTLSTDESKTTTTSDVIVDGETVGKLVIGLPADDPAAEGEAVWTNGTVVVQATGPGVDLARFYAGFGW